MKKPVDEQICNTPWADVHNVYGGGLNSAVVSVNWLNTLSFCSPSNCCMTLTCDNSDSSGNIVSNPGSTFNLGFPCPSATHVRIITEGANTYPISCGAVPCTLDICCTERTCAAEHFDCSAHDNGLWMRLPGATPTFDEIYCAGPESCTAAECCTRKTCGNTDLEGAYNPLGFQGTGACVTFNDGNYRAA